MASSKEMTANRFMIGKLLKQAELDEIRINESSLYWETYCDVVTTGDYSIVSELLEEGMFHVVHELFTCAVKYSEQVALQEIVNIVFETKWCPSIIHTLIDHEFEVSVRLSADIKHAPWLIWLEEYCRCYPETVNLLHPNTGLAPMHLAIAEKVVGPSSISRIEILVRYGGDLNVADRYGATPLHHAAAAGSSFLCEYLIKNGANKFTTDGLGRTPADVAFLYGQFSCVELCSANGNYKLEHPDCDLCYQEVSEMVDHFNKYEKIYTTRKDFNGGAPGTHLVTHAEMERVVEFEDIDVHNVPKEVNVDTMLKHLQHSSHGSRNVFLQPTKTKEMKSEVLSLVEALLAKVSEEEPILQFETCITGSSVQGGKVSLPDEFDINCVLVSLSKYCQAKPVSDHSGYAIAKFDTGCDIPPEYLKFCNEETGSIEISALVRLFNNAFISAIEYFYYQGWSSPNISLVFPNPPYKAGDEREENECAQPVYELQLYWDDFDVRHLQVKVDIALILELVSLHARSHIHFSEPTSLFADSKAIDRCFLIPIGVYPTPYLPEGFCRISFTLQENAIFQHMLPAAKDAYGLLKSLIAILGRTQVSLHFAFIAFKSCFYKIIE